MMKKIKFEEKTTLSLAGDKTLEVMHLQDGRVDFEIDSPWYGDSQSGYGATLNIAISKEDAQALRDFLNSILA